MDSLNLSQELINFFDEAHSVSHKLSLDESFLFICREDGVALYEKSFHQRPKKLPREATVLACGAWQASASLQGFLESKEYKSDEFRFSFDQSDAGIYILPLTLRGEAHLIGVLYEGRENPASLKLTLRNITNLIQEDLQEAKECEGMDEETGKKEEALFSDISDDEIDLMFSFAES